MTARKLFSFPPDCWLCEIDDIYLQSTVSYYGFSKIVPRCSEAMYLLQGYPYDGEIDQELSESCLMLYGLLHARYITTQEGVELMNHKYRSGLFGHCPRDICRNQNLLPIGLTDMPGKEYVKGYCPRCQDIYKIDKQLDGAFFGETFPMMFIKLIGMPLRSPHPNPSLLKLTDPDGNELPEMPSR